MENVSASEYQALRKYLFAVAYNITGQIQEAEDIVHDTFEFVLTKRQEDIRNTRAYLTRIAVNKSIDRLKALQKQRETYRGTWLPQPYISELDEEKPGDILPLAFLHLLEVLNPVERAIVILREAFNYTYAELAEMTATSEANCRQLLHRAKTKMKPGANSSSGNTSRGIELVNAFLEANISQDATRLQSLLQEDILLYSDGGGKVVAALNVLKGIMRITRFLLGISGKKMDNWKKAKIVSINGEPGLLLPGKQGIYLAASFEYAGNSISRILIIRNPDKLFFPALSQH